MRQPTLDDVMLILGKKEIELFALQRHIADLKRELDALKDELANKA